MIRAISINGSPEWWIPDFHRVQLVETNSEYLSMNTIVTVAPRDPIVEKVLEVWAAGETVVVSFSDGNDDDPHDQFLVLQSITHISRGPTEDTVQLSVIVPRGQVIGYDDLLFE